MPVPSQRLLDLEDLQDRIEGALMAYEPVRSSPVPLRLGLVPPGRVRLEGWVRSRAINDAVDEIVRRVPGVDSVEFDLVADPELEIKAARALAVSPETAGLPVGSVILRAYLGSMRLIGHVPSNEARDSVAKVVEGVDGVRQIENELTVNRPVGKK